ncbi:serine hydrolase domain-containing protein [Eilatimonas milleporae]|nr:serine hydrolase domain-containing protein [Eilatimonas milleporae]
MRYFGHPCLSICPPALVALALAACDPAPAPPPDPRHAALDRAVGALVAEHGIMTAGVGLIEDGALVWAGYYGLQAPDVAASRTTQFDIGSITKVVAAETVLRLADRGALSLDEPMGAHWVDPDLRGNPRVMALTPRMALTHTTGFPNWRNQTADGRLRFLNDPGTAYGYSGEGFDYLARFVAAKLDRPFPDLVRAEVFAPLGLENDAFAFRADNLDTVARSVDETTGAFDTRWRYHCLIAFNMCPEDGAYSAARDMAITVEGLAAILISVMNGDGYGAALAADRNRVQSVKDRALVACDPPGADGCPTAQGYGLGWEVLDYGDAALLSHGGSDVSSLSQAAFHTGTRDGLIVLLNAAKLPALRAMPDILEALAPGTPLAGQYRGWLRYEEALLRSRQQAGGGPG